MAGPAFPLCKQKFEYDPGPLSLGIPGTSLAQRGNFALDARGGVVLGAAVAVDLTPAFGLARRTLNPFLGSAFGRASRLPLRRMSATAPPLL